MSIITRISRAMKPDEGIALPTVIGIGLAMLIMVAGSMTVVSGGMAKTNTDEDISGALAAAYAGVEEYQSRLANDSTYQKYGNPSAPFSSATGSTVVLPAKENKAFGLGATGTWADVPVSAGDTVASSYRYEIDNHDYQNKGVLHLRSTGRMGTTTRSVVVDLKQKGFIDYLYFTDYETLDPAYVGGAAAVTDPDTGKPKCEVHAWEDGGRSSDCTEISFVTGDTFAGPVRSNDRLVICGAIFKQAVLSASTTTPIYKKSSGCSPDFRAGAPKKVDTIGMPPTNTELRRESRNDLPADVPTPGCLYTGPTSITFSVNASGVPRMNVLSPWTKFTNVAATKAGAANPDKCGKPGNVTNGLGSPTGADLDVLNLNLIYVQGVPPAGADDANAPATASFLPPNTVCTTGTYNSDVNKSTPAGWYYSSGGVYQARYPMANETRPYGPGVGDHYGCTAGDVYIKGTLSGQTTVAAANFIYVTGDLLYKDRTKDMLGLIGNNAIFVWNPVKYKSSSSWDNLMSINNREIDAALLSVAHTFQVQNYLWGDRGTLTVFGSIAQKFRGTVLNGSNGFAKNYLYDERFKTTAPPKFLTPVSTTYGVTQFATVPAAFTYTGATG